MLAVFTAPDAVVIASVVTAAVSGIATFINSRRAAKQTKPNGGSSMRDAIDRTEAAVKFAANRVDHTATVVADILDRVAVLEAAHRLELLQHRDPDARTRTTDQETSQ